MIHAISLRFVVQHWGVFAMQDGYTLHSTVVYAEPVPGGYLPAFVGKDGTRIIVGMSSPLPTELAARNALRNVLWGAHCANRINLLPHPTTATEERVA